MKKCEGYRVKLIHLATEVTKTFGLDYYREIKQMTFIITESVFESDDDRIEVKKNRSKLSLLLFPYIGNLDNVDFMEVTMRSAIPFVDE